LFGSCGICKVRIKIMGFPQIFLFGEKFCDEKETNCESRKNFIATLSGDFGIFLDYRNAGVGRYRITSKR
jgi:hypothetical protein